jgi:hypothetical protein
LVGRCLSSRYETPPNPSFFFVCIFIRIVPVNLEAPCVYSFGTLLKNH